MSLILFDFDGVLADTLNDMLLFAQEVCGELGMTRTVTQDDLNALETMSFAEYGHQLGVPESQVNEFVRRCLKRFNEKETPPSLFSGLGRILRDLSQRHTLAIISGNTTQNIQAFLTAHELGPCFQAVFGIDAPGSKREKIEQARRRLMRGDEDVFMVGDSVSDVRAAKEASVHSIAVCWGHQSAEKLASAAPDYLIHTPENLLEIFKVVKRAG